ncbi:MAG: glycosyltransferase family 4 protein [Deltaproteobacteria bacterium]|nr:glycosyltransferase family 4 protein [Deltaproteobacteria bacterium]
MKVGIAVRRWSERGGLEGNVLELARYLSGRGHEVHIVAHRIEADVPGIVTHRVEDVPTWPEWHRIQRFSSAAARALVRLRSDVTFTSSAVAGPDVVRLEGGIATEYWTAYPRARWDLRERAVARIDKARLRESKAILVLSEATARTLTERHAIEPSRIHIVRNGIDLDHFVPLTQSLRSRSTLRPCPIVAFLGSGFKRKGLAPLIEAMRGMTARLVVAGRDRRAPHYIKRARHSGVDLEYLGFVRDVRDVLERADVIAAPSLYDPFGLVVLEGLAAGRPVVTTRATGAHEISPFADLVVDEPRPALLREALERAFVHAATPHTAECARAAAMLWPREKTYAQVEEVLLSMSARSGIRPEPCRT